MIIFVVMAVIMAATMPMISGRHRVVPDGLKEAHGVFECIPDENGDFVSQKYKLNSNGELETDGPRRVDPTGCTFNSMPKDAKKFKVDLYSAGAGGTNYADIRVEKVNANQLEMIRLGDLPGILRGGDMHGISAESIVDAFQGTTVRKSLSIPDGQDGGDASFEYISPADAVCTVVLDKANELMSEDNSAEINRMMSVGGALSQYNGLSGIYKAAKNENKDELQRLIGDEYNAAQMGANSYTSYYNAVSKDAEGHVTYLDDNRLTFGYPELKKELQLYLKADSDTEKNVALANIKKIANNIAYNIYENLKNEKFDFDDGNGKQNCFNDDDAAVANGTFNPDPNEILSIVSDDKRGKLNDKIKKFIQEQTSDNIVNQSLYQKIYSPLLNGGILDSAKHPTSQDGENVYIAETKFSLRNTDIGIPNYAGRKDLMFPLANSEFNAMLIRQLNNYCEAMFPEYYYASGSNYNPKYLYTTANKSDDYVYNFGGSVGRYWLFSQKNIEDLEVPDQGYDIGGFANARKKLDCVANGSGSGTCTESFEGDNQDFSKENYYRIINSNPGPNGYSVVEQKGGKGGHGGALVLEYRMQGVAPARYGNRVLGRPHGQLDCVPTEINDFDTLAFYSDLFNGTERDICGEYRNPESGVFEFEARRVHGMPDNPASINENIGRGDQLIRSDLFIDTTEQLNNRAGARPEANAVLFADMIRQPARITGTDGQVSAENPRFRIRVRGVARAQNWIAGGDGFSTVNDNSVESIAMPGHGGRVGFCPNHNGEDAWPVLRVYALGWGELEEQACSINIKTYRDINLNANSAQPGEPTVFANPIDLEQNFTEWNDSELRNMQEANHFIAVRNRQPIGFTNIGDRYGNIQYRVGGANEPQFQEPAIQIRGAEFDVTYKVGGPGGPGEHRTFNLTPNQLGDNCQITLSPGGAPLNVQAGQSIATVQNTAKRLMDINSTVIRCTADGGATSKFSQSIPGGNYNISAIIGDEYVDSTGLNNVSDPQPLNEKFERFVHSVASFIFNWWSSKGDDPLSNVGNGGAGTQLTACTANGGATARVVQLATDSSGNNPSVIGVIKDNVVMANEDDDEHDCGVNLPENINEVRTRTIFAAEDGQLTNNNDNLATPAGVGGPGAVIITW